MMEFISYLVVAVAVGALIYWLVIEGDSATAVQQLPSSEELKKLKKAELVELAKANGIFVDPKSTKVVIIKEIDLHR